MVLLARTNHIHEAFARLPLRMGAARPRPPGSSTSRRDAPQPDRVHRLDGENQVNSPKRIVWTALLSLLIVPFTMAQTVKFAENKLKNGLRVILSEDHSAP